MKKIIILASIICFFINLKAQDSSYSQKFDNTYKNVNFSKSKSKIIFERSFNFTGFNEKRYNEPDTLKKQ